MKLSILKTLFLALSAVMMLGLGGCGSSGTPTDDGFGSSLEKIRISPENLNTLPSGVKVQYEATAIYSDGKEADITSEVTWSSDNTSVATVSTSGEVTSIAEGVATITAKKDGVSATTKVRVAKEPVTSLASIQLTFKNGETATTVPAGTTGELVATAVMTDGTTFDANAFVMFTSSSNNVEIGINGYAKAASAGNASLTASYHSVTSNTVSVTVTAATLQSIKVSPQGLTLPVNANVQYSAKGTYSDGTIVDITKDVSWTSNNTAIAKINTEGKATAITAGTATISANKDGKLASANLTVLATSLKEIQLTLANGATSVSVPTGTTGNLKAIAVYSDGTSRDITAQTTFTSSQPKIVDVQKGGSAKAIAQGSSNLTAVFDNVTSNTVKVTVTAAALQSISVSAADNPMINGTSTTMSAVGIYSDGSDHDITKDVSWISNDTTVITMNGNSAKAVGIGDTTVVATLDGISSTLNMTVEQAQVTALRIVKDNGSFLNSDEFVVGETLKVKALADFDNGVTNRDVTDKVIWEAGDEGTVSVSNNGLITALKAGSASVIAYYQGEFGKASDKITGNVVAKTLTKIEIFTEPANAAAPAGEEIRLEAWAIYNDGTNQNVSDTTKWSSSDAKVTLIYSKDEKCIYATSNEKATSTVTASKDALSATQNVTFEKKVFDHIEIQDGHCTNSDCPIITGKTVDIPIVDDVNYDPVSEGAYYPTAWAVYTDGSKKYITSSLGIRWWSKDQIRAYVNTVKGSFVFGRGLGNKIEISVSYRGEHRTSFYVNVKEDTTTKTLKKIGILNTKKQGWGCSQDDSIYGEKLTMITGDEGKYLQACGQFEYSTGTVKWEDINNNVAWFSSDRKVARVQTYTGELKALGGGNTVVSAQLAGIKGTIDVTVLDQTPDHIELQEGYCENAKCPVITGKTIDIPIVDDVNYNPVSLGAYYPTAWLVFTDGTKQYIGSTSGIRWWSADQVRAYVNTTKGSFVFGRGLGNGIEISVNYRGDHRTSFYVNVKEDTTEKKLKQIGIKNTKDAAWGCTQNDSDYGQKITVKKRNHGKYVQACGKFEYKDGTSAWEDINNNVAWFSTDNNVTRVRTTTGELRAINIGTATISAHVAQIKGAIDVEVK